MHCIIKTIAFAAVLSLSNLAVADASPRADAARADIDKTFGFVPAFMNQIPDAALPGAWQEMKELYLSKTALPAQIKELISLAVAAQIPCRYCTYSHTQFARLNGASEDQIGFAVAVSAMVRKWSAVLGGLDIDQRRYRTEIDRVVAAKKAHPKKFATTGPLATDARSAAADAKARLGFVPEFLWRYPAEGRAGVWNELLAIELTPNKLLRCKYKSLIALAVASQIPCRMCVYAHTRFAKLNGASDREIAEAVAMASYIRHWSTLLNGLQADEQAFRRDIDRLVANVREARQAVRTSRN